MAVKRTAATKVQSAAPPSLAGAAVEHILELASAQEMSRLFPDGVDSIDLELESGTGGRVSLKIQGRPASSGVATAEEAPLMLDGGVTAQFNAEGHHVIALIAQADLNQRFPATMAKVQKVLDGGGRDLLSAATFPDDIRSQQPATKIFHFVDIPLQAGGPANPPLPAPPNVISKIADFTVTLKHGGTAKVLIDPLSWLIHLIGDIHQPLHCVTRITAIHPAPDGDRGGNSFTLKGSPHNLHALWDSSVSFTSESEDEVATKIMQDHSRQSLLTDLAVTDVEAWARSSFSLAKQVAYGPLVENPSSPPKPSAAYLANALKTGQRQAALAGYRLADRLHDIFA